MAELFVSPILPVLVAVTLALHPKTLDQDDAAAITIVGMSATTTSQMLMAC